MMMDLLAKCQTPELQNITATYGISNDPWKQSSRGCIYLRFFYPLHIPIVDSWIEAKGL